MRGTVYRTQSNVPSTRWSGSLSVPACWAGGILAVVLSNLLVQSALLAVSLVSLADETNFVPPWIAIAAAAGGLLLLAITVYDSAIQRMMC